MTGKKNGKIEFLRFVFSIIIVFHHSRKFLGDDNCLFLGGSLAVEFFFILSGFLMMQSINKIQSALPPPPAPQTIGHETKNFIFRKIKSIYPEVIIAWVIAMGVVSFSESMSFVTVVKRAMLNIYEVIFLYMFGIGSNTVNGVTWYISSMILCMLILYPLIRKYPDFSLNVVVPLSMLLVYGYLFQNFTNPRNPPHWLGVTFKGNLRAYADICMGILAYNLCKRIKKINWNKLGRFLITTAESGIYIFAIWYMYSLKATDLDYFCILLMAVAVALTFSGFSLDVNLFSNPATLFLGRFSLPLYLSHTFYSKESCFIFNRCASNTEKMCVYLLASVVTAGIVMAVSNFIRQHKFRLLGKIKHLIIETDCV